MPRLRFDFMQGTLSSSASDSTTSLTSAEFAGFPEVVGGSGKVIAITLDPGAGGAREIVHITAHSTAATTATVVRGREGTTAAAHASAVAWVHAPTAADFEVSHLHEPAPPSSPSAYDDEFDGWSTVTWSDTPTAATTKDTNSFVSGCLHLKGVGTNNNLIGVVQAPPGSFPYTITFQLASRGAPVNYHRNGGIILSNGLTSGSSVWYVGQVWDGLQKWWVGNQSYAGAFYTSPGSHAGRGDAKYGRVTVASASSATAYYSDDGYVWVELVTFNPGFTPTHMGLACSQDTTNSINTEATFGFFRVT